MGSDGIKNDADHLAVTILDGVGHAFLDDAIDFKSLVARDGQFLERGADEWLDDGSIFGSYRLAIDFDQLCERCVVNLGGISSCDR